MKLLYKRGLSLLLALLFAVGLIPTFAFSVFSADVSTTSEATEQAPVDKTAEPVTITNGDYSLTINKTAFEVGEPILVSGTGTDYNTWIGLYSVNSSSAGDSTIVWKYVRNAGQGVAYNIATNYDGKEDKNFDLSNGYLPEGEYIIRLFSDGSSNATSVKALVHIKVGNPPYISGEQGILSIDKRNVTSGEAVMVSADLLYDDTWVGVYEYGRYSKSSLFFYWVKNAGDGVPYNAVAGRNLTGGAYLFRLCPHDGAGFGNDISSALVIVEDAYNVSYLSRMAVIEDGTGGGSGSEGGGDSGGEDVGGGNTGTDTPTQPENKVTFEESGSPVKITNGDFELCVNKTVFEVGEKIYVSGKGPNEKDFIAIYRIQDNACVMYQFIDTVGDGVWYSLTDNYIEGHFYDECSSLPEGEYVIRLQADDSDYFEGNRALVRIKIGDPEVGQTFGQSELLSTNKNTYKPGESIMVSASMVQGYTDSWVGIYSFNNFHKNGSVTWEWVANMGESYDITEGITLQPGIYLIRLIPYDTEDMSTVVAYKTVLVESDTAISYETIVTDKTLGTAPPTGIGNPSVTVSNDTHSLTVNKTQFAVGEPIMVTAKGVDSKDWIGIAVRDSREASIRWYYISTVGNGNSYNLAQAPNIGGNLGHLADLPQGLYTVVLVERDQLLSKDLTFSINISIGNVEDSANGEGFGGDVTVGGTVIPPFTSVYPPLSATYTQQGNGYASGTVSITMPVEAINKQNIVMYWANENGKLQGYTAHARKKVTSSVVNYTFSDSVIIPSGATKLLIYSENSSTGELSEEFISVDITSTIGELGTPNGAFFAISDVHIGSANGAKHFKLMLNEAIKLYPNGAPIFVAGDVTDNGYESQYIQLMELYDEVMEQNGADGSKYPLFLAIGNHDYPSAQTYFLAYATLPDGSHPTDTCYDFWLNGYHYIFLGGDNANGLNATFTEETLAWLDETLAECRDTSRPTFIFLHQPLYDTVSGSLPGEGWNGVTNEDAFKAVISKYPEIIMFNGHTHWEMNSVGNIFEGTDELPIHIFNCASISYLWSGFNAIKGEELYGSHGYAVELYNGKILVKGRDFVNGEWISSAQYLIELGENTADSEHNYQNPTISYANGYLQKGTITSICAICGNAKAETAPELVKFLGYSTKVSNSSAICVSYFFDLEMIEQYELNTGKVLDFGFVYAVDNKLPESGKPLNADGSAKELQSGKIICGDIPSSCSYIDLILRADNWTAHASTPLIISAYVIDENGLGYIYQDTISDTADIITYQELIEE